MTAAELDDIAARALTSIILTHTADAIADEGERAADALAQLAESSGLALEIAAAVLYATTSLTALGEMSAENVYAAALTFEPDENADLAALDEGEPEGHIEPSPARPTVVATVLTSLTEDQRGADCDRCECGAIGTTGGRLVCFFHLDHDDSHGLCPTCLTSKGGLHDEEE